MPCILEIEISILQNDIHVYIISVVKILVNKVKWLKRNPFYQSK